VNTPQPSEASRPIRAPDQRFFVPAPTARTRALRTFIPWQIWRFIVINLRMFRMIAKSHSK
jgi:hypothetical protein